MKFTWLMNIKLHNTRHKWPGRELGVALGPLARRVTLRYWLESTRLALLWGLAVSGAVLALLRLYPALPATAALIGGGAAVLAVTALRFYLRPDALTVVRVADELGANGEAVTAFRLLETGAADLWSREALHRGIAGCNRIAGEAGYSAIPRWRSWRDLALLTAVLLVLQLVPDTLGSHWAERRAEQQALRAAAAEARQAVDQVRDLQVNGNDILPEEVRKKLGDLPGEVARAGDRREAAAQLERARWELDGTRAVIDPSAGRDMQRLTDAWTGAGQEWQDLAQALEDGDGEDIQQAVRDLTDKVQEDGTEAKMELAASLFASAGMVENPALRKALRDTAGATVNSAVSGGQSGAGGGTGRGDENLAAAAGSLADALSSAAATASAGSALGSASSTLSSLAGDLNGAGSAGQGTQLAGNNEGSESSGNAGQTGSTPGSAAGAGSSGSHGPGET